MVTRRLPPSREDLPSSARKLEKYKNVQVYAKLEDCSSVEVEMRNGEMGLKNVKDGEVGWTPVVRRRKKKSAWSEESEFECAE